MTDWGLTALQHKQAISCHWYVCCS